MPTFRYRTKIAPDGRGSADMRNVHLEVGNKEIGTAKTWAYPNGAALGVFTLPTYALTVRGMNGKGGAVVKTFEVFRFGLLCKDPASGASVVGLANAQSHIIKAWLPHYRVHSAPSREDGAWQVYDNFLIHDGPDDTQDKVSPYASIGCIELCGPQQFIALNDLIIELSGPSAAKRADQLAEIGRSKTIEIKYLPAKRPKASPG